ncbi:hypothetical protein ABZS86_32215 [Streptomyces sp. NPDC005355]|uniref:hypothetical protein n=1 Tax=Streptomyces sp. NPDC005355 TaxID=3157038 RepID=UPI0033AED1A0
MTPYKKPYEDMSKDAEPVRPRMTMRVYRVSPDGAAVTRQLSRITVMADDKLAPLRSSQFPPCRCPLHRDRVDPGPG